MSPIQFKNIREGDLLRDAYGRGHTVLEATGGDYVVVQNIVRIPIAHAERWKIYARMTPCTEVPVTKPGPFEMHEQLMDAGFACVGKRASRKYTKSGAMYETLESAWASL